MINDRAEGSKTNYIEYSVGIIICKYSLEV